MKTNSNYKMPKHIKMWLANFLDPHVRGSRKRGFIEAHLYALETAKAAEKENKRKGNGKNQSSED